MLPLATSTDTEVLTKRLRTFGRVLMEIYRFPLRITILLTGQLNINHVSRSDEGYKYHHIVHSRDSLALGGYVRNGYLF